MPFQRDTIKTISRRITSGISSRLFGNVALLSKAVLRILARVFAGAIHTCYGRIDLVVRDMLFVTTAKREYLEAIHAKMWGVPLKPGTFATTSIRFTGTIGSTIDAETIVQSDDGIEYGTLTTVTLTSSSIDVDVQAVEAGESGNLELPAEAIYFHLVQPITGVDDDARVLSDASGGADPEDTESLRARILQRIQYPPMGGTAADYVRWALEVPGVKYAWCHPLAYGPGTVATSIVAEGSNPVPSSVLLSDVQAYIDEMKPVTADHYTESITNMAGADGYASINMYIRLTPNEPDFRSVIIDNLKTLVEPHKPGTTLLISQIRGAISASGVTDYEILWIYVDAVWHPIDDIAFTGFQYPQIGNISFTG